jgi:hypothetical protein
LHSLVSPPLSSDPASNRNRPSGGDDAIRSQPFSIAEFLSAGLDGESRNGSKASDGNEFALERAFWQFPSMHFKINSKNILKRVKKMPLADYPA